VQRVVIAKDKVGNDCRAKHYWRIRGLSVRRREIREYFPEKKHLSIRVLTTYTMKFGVWR